MNQILETPHFHKKYKWLFQLELGFSLIILLSAIFYFPYLIYQKEERTRISRSLVQPYSISKLYASLEIPYEGIPPNTPFVIGTLEIPTLHLSLPVLSELNDDLLKISVCRFYGPMPNEIGNLCIAGHNYNNGSFFSNLPNLVIGNTISLTDYSHHTTTYKVYEKYEISAKNTDCTNQNTNQKKEITLVTCNNFTGNRVIIKGIEI